MGESIGRTHSRVPLADRFWPKVVKTESCWLWSGTKGARGYGQIQSGGADGRRLQAHRVSWELSHGQSIPDGLDIDHLCRNPPCVNPEHLEPVTRAENTRRGLSPSKVAAINGTKTHCPRRHPYDEANTYITSRGARQCRACKCIRDHARRTLLKGNELCPSYSAASRPSGSAP